MSRFDISSVRQIPLDADNDIFETRKTDGCQDVVGDALFKQDRRVGGEFWVCGECSGKGGGIVVPPGVRDDISGPSQDKRHGR